MIKHSDAIKAWRSIFFTPPPFPFNAVIESIHSKEKKIAVIPLMAKLYSYFAHLADFSPSDRATRYALAKTDWKLIHPHIPHSSRSLKISFSILSEYFFQERFYTPIDITTCKPVWYT